MEGQGGSQSATMLQCYSLQTDRGSRIAWSVVYLLDTKCAEKMINRRMEAVLSLKARKNLISTAGAAVAAILRRGFSRSLQRQLEPLKSKYDCRGSNFLRNK